MPANLSLSLGAHRRRRLRESSGEFAVFYDCRCALAFAHALYRHQANLFERLVVERAAISLHATLKYKVERYTTQLSSKLSTGE